MVGRWQLVRCLGEGRWARVFAARPQDCAADRPADYVVKLLRPECQSDAQCVAMFRRESLAGQCVSHPHLISVLSAHVHEPPFYLVTPRLRGSTLAALIRSGQPFSLPRAIWIVRQTAEAAAQLHASGWLHRDLKPSNIVVSPQGHATVIDLGFAARVGQTDDTLMGTPSYAAPELFCVRGLGGRHSDVYSLGITLFELLTGRLPFEHIGAHDLAIAHVQQPPPDPRKYAPGLPPRVVRLVKRMLAKEPLRRPSANELVDILYELEVDTFDDR